MSGITSSSSSDAVGPGNPDRPMEEPAGTTPESNQTSAGAPPAPPENDDKKDDDKKK